MGTAMMEMMLKEMGAINANQKKTGSVMKKLKAANLNVPEFFSG